MGRGGRGNIAPCHYRRTEGGSGEKTSLAQEKGGGGEEQQKVQFSQSGLPPRRNASSNFAHGVAGGG